MVNDVMLTDSEDRRSKILVAVVEGYIDTGSPVGSQMICEKYRLGVSSATIRNVMGDLEAQGLIMQPHTSAGRVPTDRGYRAYVNALRELLLDPEQARRVDALLGQTGVEPAALLDRAARLMAELTRQAAVALYPVLRRNAFKRLEVVPLDGRRLLCVLVTMQGLVRSIIIEVDEPVTAEELHTLLRFLNTELQGMGLDAVEEFLQRRILAQHDSFFHLLKRALQILHLALESGEAEPLRLEGASYMLMQPEFQDAERTRLVLQFLETRQELVGLLQEDLAREGIQVHIGQELPQPAMSDCSLVTMTYRINGQVVGGLGVLGPKRMEYPRVMAMVDYVARRVGELLSEAVR